MAANPPHPNAARLWLDFWFSREGQEAVANGGNIANMPGVRLSQPDLAIQGKKLILLESVVSAEKDAFLMSFSAKYPGLFP
jgi:ABC-type Fe3+ transport system substrate-binding protein